MIKINLASRKQSGLSSDSKGPRLGSFGKLDLDRIKELPIRKVAAPLIIGLVASYALDFYKEEEIKKLDATLAQLNAEGTNLQNEISKLKAYEPIKKTLDEDEVTIKTKLETIHKLITDRGFPGKILLSIATSMPKNVWLSDIKVEPEELYMKGFSLDFNQISDFMKSLNENAFFSEVALKDSQQVKDQSGLDVAGFELKIKRR